MDQKQKAKLFDSAGFCYRNLIRPHLVELTKSTETPIDDYVLTALDFILRYKDEED